MLETAQIEEVTQVRMGREFEGQVLYWVAAYLVDGLLIDTGCRHTAEEFAEFLDGKYLKLAVNTHHHEDHIGANHILMKKFGIKIFASAESAPLIRQVPRIPSYRELVWGFPDPAPVDILPDKIVTDHFRFDAVDTPGHCDGHVTLVEPSKGWCFSGDLFVSRQPMAIRPEDDIARTIESMKKLVDLKTERLVLFTSLGKVVPDGREALQSCMEYFQCLAKRAKQLQKQGLSVGAIRDEIFGRETSLAEPSEGDFSAENMIQAVLRAEVQDLP